jgi:hypothetical protein
MALARLSRGRLTTAIWTSPSSPFLEAPLFSSLSVIRNPTFLCYDPKTLLLRVALCCKCLTMRTPFLLLSLSLLTHAQGPYEGSCYFPNGTYTPDQHPCDPYAFTSLCCPTGWTCFSNRLCIITSASTATTDDPVGTTIRGTCTDFHWNGPTCGDFCLCEHPLQDFDLRSRL